MLSTIPDGPNNDIALVDHLMVGLALFGLKYPSVLQFQLFPAAPRAVGCREVFGESRWQGAQPV